MLKNKPTENERIDQLAELLSTHQMKSTAFYEKELGVKVGTLHPMMLLYSGMSFKDWRKSAKRKHRRLDEEPFLQQKRENYKGNRL